MMTPLEPGRKETHSRARSDGLTSGRVYGKPCLHHPELNGLRVRDRRAESRGWAGGAGRCVECQRKRQIRDYAETLHCGVDKKYGDTGKELWLALCGMGGVA
jgi:hypothetical protein